MFPVSILVAIAATVSGIGGTALFTPIFLLAFPILGAWIGAELALVNPVTAFAAALTTATFGFTSGFIGYTRARLVDYRLGLPFIVVGVPCAVLGAIYAHRLSSEVLQGAYAVLMLFLAVFVWVVRADSASKAPPVSGSLRTITTPHGATHAYRLPQRSAGVGWAASGGVLTGMVSVGLGELLMPQLLNRFRIPLPVAAATSVLVVVVVFLAASSAHILRVLASGQSGNIPWNLLVYTVPGVVIGAQIGPHLQGRLSDATMVRVIGVFFAFVGLAMGTTVLTGS